MQSTDHIFLSYRSTDFDFVVRLAQQLKQTGLRVWMDKLDGIRGGDDWQEQIEQAINTCAAMIAVVTPEYVKSKNCRREMIRADELDRPIFPVLLEPVDKHAWPYALQGIQYVDFRAWTDEDIFFRQLRALMEVLTGALGGTSPALAVANAAIAVAQTVSQVIAKADPKQHAERIAALDTSHVLSQVASAPEKRIFVAGGPGTGKTRALMLRIARLIADGVDPARILAVTFTRAAAYEMHNNLRSLAVPRLDRLQIGTLHAFCFNVLKRGAFYLQTGRVARPLLPFEVRFMLEDLKEDPGFGDLRSRESRLRALETRWMRGADDNPASADPIAARFEEEVEEWLRFHQAMLISEMMPRTFDYLANNPAADELRQFDHVIVDEYQDLNLMEQRLIDMLNERGALCVAGDPDQSIYSFRGAHPQGVTHLAETAKDTRTIHLQICQRCAPNVIEMANSLIARNRSRLGQPIIPSNGRDPASVTVLQWQNAEMEARGVAAHIARQIAAGKLTPGQVVVLCPRRHFAELVAEALTALDVPAENFFNDDVLKGNPKDGYDCAAQEAFTLLTLAANPNNRVALRCWLGFGHPELRSKQFARLRDYCKDRGLALREALDSLAAGRLTIPHLDNLLDRYRGLVRRLNALRDKTGQALIDAIFPPGLIWAEPIRDVISYYIPEGESRPAPELLDLLRTHITQQETPEDVDFVRVMSLHKSKGLTADHVIIVGCAEGVIPATAYGRLSSAAVQSRLEEQRRLFYVAISRARRSLVISSARKLPRKLAEELRSKQKDAGEIGVKSDPQVAVASTFIPQLGSACPRPQMGEEWLQNQGNQPGL